MKKPNITFPLAATYNVRGQDGFTNTFTNSLDQRKINTKYSVGFNKLTFKQTIYLSKRPGVILQNASFGTTGQVAYLASMPAGATSLASSPWVYSVSGNDVRASSSAATTVIVTAAGYLPAFVDITAVSGVDNVVLQTRTAAGLQRVFYGTAIATWTEITDSDFTGLTVRGKMEFIDGYALAFDSMSRIYNSDINSLASWPAGSFITKQIRQDVPVSLARFGQQILAFGEKTVEVFNNTGTGSSGSPLTTVKELAARVGMDNILQVAGVTNCYATLGKFMYFIGRDGENFNARGLIAYNGSSYERVSTPFIESILNSAYWYSVNAVSVSGQDAIAIALDPTTASTQRWLMFFPKYNDWFEWNSTVFTPVGNGTFFLGVGANQHKVYYFPLPGVTEQWQDDTTNFTSTHQFQWPKDDNQYATMSMFSVVGDTARSASSLGVQFSDDDGVTWSTVRNIDMTSSEKKLTKCGAFKQRQVRLTHTANLDVRMRDISAIVK